MADLNAVDCNASRFTQSERAGDVRCTTVLPPKADVHPRSCYVAFVPIADIRAAIS
jgi:hypothetical protein